MPIDRKTKGNRHESEMSNKKRSSGKRSSERKRKSDSLVNATFQKREVAQVQNAINNQFVQQQVGFQQQQVQVLQQWQPEQTVICTDGMLQQPGQTVFCTDGMLQQPVQYQVQDAAFIDPSSLEAQQTTIAHLQQQLNEQFRMGQLNMLQQIEQNKPVTVHEFVSPTHVAYQQVGNQQVFQPVIQATPCNQIPGSQSAPVLFMQSNNDQQLHCHGSRGIKKQRTLDSICSLDETDFATQQNASVTYYGDADMHPQNYWSFTPSPCSRATSILEDDNQQEHGWVSSPQEAEFSPTIQASRKAVRKSQSCGSIMTGFHMQNESIGDQRQQQGNSFNNGCILPPPASFGNNQFQPPPPPPPPPPESASNAPQRGLLGVPTSPRPRVRSSGAFKCVARVSVDAFKEFARSIGKL